MSALRHSQGTCLEVLPYWYAHGRTDGRTDGDGTYLAGNMTLSYAREKGPKNASL